MILFYFYSAIKYWFHLIQCAHFIDTLWLTLPCWSFLEVKNHSATLSWCSWKRRIIITDATGDEWLNHTSNKRGWKVFTHLGVELQAWVTASHFEEAQHLLYMVREQKRRRQTDGKWETQSCGNGDFKVRWPCWRGWETEHTEQMRSKHAATGSH